MKYGLISLDFRRFPLERCFQIAARYDYDGVEIWGGRPHAWPFDMDADAVAQTRALMKTYDVEVPMYTPAALGMGLCLCSPSRQERDDALRHFERGVDVAAALEVPRMLVVADHPGFDADQRQTWARLVEAASVLADYAAPKGVALRFEPLTPIESPLLTTTDELVALLAAVDRPNVGAMLDVVPPTVACEPLSAYFTKLGGVDYIHLCNSDGMTDAHLELDGGVLSIQDVLAVFDRHGYDSYITIELYTVSTRDPEVAAAKSMRLLQSWRLAGLA